MFTQLSEGFDIPIVWRDGGGRCLFMAVESREGGEGDKQ